MLLDAEGLITTLDKTAVNKITNKATLKCLPNLVLQTYTDITTTKHIINKTQIGLLIKLIGY